MHPGHEFPYAVDAHGVRAVDAQELPPIISRAERPAIDLMLAPRR